MISANEYQAHDGIALAQMLRDGQIGTQELFAAMLSEVARLNPQINAIVHSMPEVALMQLSAQAQRTPKAIPASPLAGLPIFVKDLLADIAQVPTKNGSRLFADYLPQQDAEIIRRYREAGLLFLAKTTTPEFGLLAVTESELTGITRNPWDTTRTTGGSSGGSAAAVACRIVPIAHGGDGGGSIRIPASNCGVFGLKPSRGSSPCGPHFSENWQGFVVQHVLTRSVRDSAAMLDILLSRQDTGDAYRVFAPETSYFKQLEQPLPRLKIAYSEQAFTGGNMAPAVKAALMQSVKILRNLGHHVEAAQPALAAPEQLCRAMVVMVCGELACLMRNAPQLLGRKANFRDVEAGTWALARYGEMLSAGEFAWMRDLSLAQGRVMEQFFTQYDVLLTPVINQLPALHGSLLPSPFEQKLSRILLGHLGWDWTLRTNSMIEDSSRRMMEYLGWTIPLNMSGNPAMSVPLYWTSQAEHAGPSLPIGSQFVAGIGKDGLLLQLARELEQAVPWAQHKPPIC